MTEPNPTPPDPVTPGGGHKDKPIPDILVDPFTGERIYSPRRAKLIEEELDRLKQKPTGGATGDAD